MSLDLKAKTRAALKACTLKTDALPRAIVVDMQVSINELREATEPQPGIPYWWWTPTGGHSLIANTFQSEGREQSPRWVDEYRPALVLDKVLVDASYKLIDRGVHPLEAEVVVAEWLKSVLDGPLYPPQGVEEYLREWCGAAEAVA